MISRRTFIRGALVVASAPLATEAQQAGKVYRIGLMLGSSVSAAAPHVDEFRQGLRELGWVEGKNFALEIRAAEGKYERFPAFAAELVRLKVDLIVAPTGPAAEAAKNATRTIPIVMMVVPDPVGSGLVASLARPGGNITGLSSLLVELSAKQLEILKEAIPQASRVSVLQNPAAPASPLMVKEVEGAARLLGTQLQVLAARSPEEFDGAFATMIRGRSDALFVLADPMFFLHRTRLADLAAKSRLPTMYAITEHAEAGGLMAYAANGKYNYRRAASYVDKILKGAKPADLPVEQPTRFELVINMKTAKALGLTIPPLLLLRADRLIE
jgi:putative ABC transport system substrate-binding protein